MSFRLYNSLMGLAKESLALVGPEGAEAGKGPDLVDLGLETNPELMTLVQRLKELLTELPKANLATLRYIARHLRRIVELEEDNKMSPSNLGIVFGPSLMRPRPSGATVSLSSLVDYPYQARIVETLIVFYTTIFPSESHSTGSACAVHSPSLQQESSMDGEDSGTNDGDDADHTEEHGGTKTAKLKDQEGSTLGSMEHSLDSDSELEEEVQAEAQPLIPTDHCSFEDPDHPPAADDLQSPSDLDSEPPALPETEPPALPETEPPALPETEPPALPETEPPDLHSAEEEEAAASCSQKN